MALVEIQGSNTFIQNIHHFRDDNLRSDKAPIEKVVVFDEAQRAWTNKQVSSFMKRKKAIPFMRQNYLPVTCNLQFLCSLLESETR